MKNASGYSDPTAAAAFSAMGRQKREKPQLRATESAEQIALFEWAAWNETRYPELRWMHHIPNGGSRHKAEAARLKAQGVKAGVPDICLPVARKGLHGLYIELKRANGKGRISEAQVAWLSALRGQGYCAEVAHGWHDAVRVIAEYLGGE